MDKNCIYLKALHEKCGAFLLKENNFFETNTHRIKYNHCLCKNLILCVTFSNIFYLIGMYNNIDRFLLISVENVKFVL